MKKIVIVGGGFGGARLARLLGRHTPVTLINDSEHFRYSPALYRAATGKRMASVRLPLDWMLLDVPSINLKIGKAVAIDTQLKEITLDTNEKVSYDIAAFALGSVTSYFGIKGLSDNAQGIKSYEEIAELRKHLHETVLNKHDIDQNYVIVGAGPTGVELAGSLAHHLRKIARKHRIRNHKISIWLVDSAPRVLPRMSSRASKLATRRLQKNGVKLLLNTKVDSETSQSLHTDHEIIKTHTVIWTAGTANNTFFSDNPHVFPIAERGLVKVDKHFQISPSLYVFGDNASAPYGGLAFSAVQNANYIAKDILQRINHKNRKEYKGVRPIQIVPTSRNTAILQWGNLTISGRVASLMRNLADYIGYSEVMGYGRALTIWQSRNNYEETCDVCFFQK